MLIDFVSDDSLFWINISLHVMSFFVYCSCTGGDECLLLFGDSQGCVNILFLYSAGESLRYLLWNNDETFHFVLMSKHCLCISSTVGLKKGNFLMQCLLNIAVFSWFMRTVDLCGVVDVVCMHSSWGAESFIKSLFVQGCWVSPSYSTTKCNCLYIGIHLLIKKWWYG